MQMGFAYEMLFPTDQKKSSMRAIFYIKRPGVTADMKAD